MFAEVSQVILDHIKSRMPQKHVHMPAKLAGAKERYAGPAYMKHGPAAVRV